LKWMNTEKIAVNDTIVDTDLTVYLLDEATNTEIGTGLVPAERLTLMYADPTTKHKSFKLMMMGKEVIGDLQLLLRYATNTIEGVTMP